MNMSAFQLRASGSLICSSPWSTWRLSSRNRAGLAGLAAVLNDSARLCHLHGTAKLGKDCCFVPGVDNSFGADLQGDVGAFEAVAIDLGGQVLVPLILHVPGCQGWLSKDNKGKYKRTMKRTQKASRLNQMN